VVFGAGKQSRDDGVDQHLQSPCGLMPEKIDACSPVCEALVQDAGLDCGGGVLEAVRMQLLTQPTLSISETRKETVTPIPPHGMFDRQEAFADRISYKTA
jgi:hypothetical protein